MCLVGGGSAGCVLANRLSSNPSNSVLLVEAGSNDERNIFAKAPGMTAVSMILPMTNWSYNTTPQKNLANRKLWYPRGRILGGSSQLNAMCYIRGNPADYNRWAALTGDAKFNYDNVLPLFKMSQAAHDYGEDQYNGRTGYLNTSKPDLTKVIYGELANAFIQAGVQTGEIFWSFESPTPFIN